MALIYTASREPTSGLEPLTCSLRVSLSPTPYPSQIRCFAGYSFDTVVRAIILNIALYRHYCCQFSGSCTLQFGLPPVMVVIKPPHRSERNADGMDEALG